MGCWPRRFGGGGFTNGVAVVAFVGEQYRTFRHGIEQGFGLLTVVNLTAGQSQRNRTTISVKRGRGSCS